MLKAIDPATLSLCSMLASASFGVVYVALWHRLRQDRYLLHWAASSLLYAALMGTALLLPERTLLARTVFCGLLGIADVLIVTGVRALAGKPIVRPWMLVPVIAPMIGTIGPGLLAAPLAMPGLVHAGPALTLGLAVAMCGVAILRERSFATSRGQRIAGYALLAYLPGYLFAFVGSLGTTGLDLLALICMLSDHLLLGILNLGLLAIPAERAHERMREMAMKDPLTLAWNRAGMAARGVDLIRHGGALIAIDVDHFKSINDLYGHAVGDEVLMALSRRARQLADPLAGELFRVGGDEFVIILPRATIDEAKAFAATLRAMFDDRADLPPWTMSIGMTLARPNAASLEPALKRADQLLYQAKAEGRDTVTA